MDPLELFVVFSAIFCFGSVALFVGASRGDVRAAPQKNGLVLRFRDIVLVAFAVRVSAGVAIRGASLQDFFAPDRWGYEVAGAAIAEAWSGNGIVSSVGILAANGKLGVYHYYNALFFYFLGSLAPWFVLLVNAAAGAVAVPLAGRIAESVYGRRTAIAVAWSVALMPSMVLWSALNIRDAWAVLGILWSVLGACRLRERISLRSLFHLASGLALLGGIRGYMFLIIAAGIVIGYAVGLGGRTARNYLAAGITGLVFLYLYDSLGYGREMLESASFESLNRHREALAYGGSAFYEDVDISTPTKALSFLPIGVTYFLFAPFPWMLRNLRQLLTLPEMLFWWWLAFRFFLPGLREGVRRHAGHVQTLVAVSMLAIAAYGLVEGNVGTAYRHRAQVLPLLLIVACGGWVAARRSSDVLTSSVAVR